MAAIETYNLTKSFDRSSLAVEDLSIRVEHGEIYGLLGRNGAGKSTVMGMLLGLLRPSSGTYEVLGAQGARDSSTTGVGALIEAPAFYPFLTGRKNLQVLATYAGIPSTSIDSALDSVGLLSSANRRYRQYSLGMKQRLGIAAALLGSPQLIILDEPTNGLDPQAIADVRQIMLDLRDQGRTILVSSHILAEVEQVVDRVAIIANGKLIREDTIKGLRGPETASSTLSIRTTDADLAVSAATGLPGVMSVTRTATDRLVIEVAPSALPGVNMGLVAAGVQVIEQSVVEPTLESVFLRLTAETAGA